MRLLVNPIVIRLALMLFAMAFAFVLGIVAMRRMRRTFDAEAPLTAETPSARESADAHVQRGDPAAQAAEA